MRQHYDHIHSIFDGKLRGIPVLSFILNLNDDYEGADLYFWDEHIVPLGKGDIIMFPSLFLFPHGVTEATKGKKRNHHIRSGANEIRRNVFWKWYKF